MHSMMEPENKFMSIHFIHSAIVMADVVAQSLKLKTNSSHTLMTSFSPNDSYLMNMPDYGKTHLFENITLLRQVGVYTHVPCYCTTAYLHELHA